MEKQPSPTLLNLPHHAIAKIMFERWKLDRKYQPILSLLYTCKQLYYDHYHILYMLTPLVLGKSKDSTHPRDLQKWVRTRACCKIRTIYLIKPKKAIIMVVHRFPNLETVSISTSVNDIITILYKLPPSVSDLSLCITRNGMRKTVLEVVNVPTFKLKKLKFNSVCCIRRTRFSSFYDTIVGPITRNSTDPHYYKQFSPAKLVTILLAKLINGSLSTLQELDVETIHFDQVNLVLKSLMFNFGSPSKIQALKVDKLGWDQAATLDLIEICKKLHFTDNHLGLKYILQNQNGVVVQKVIANKRDR
ncbi:hypothetical protein FOB58_003329 [Candida parapsilosis]|uniref:F-box domain-containing protein n=2 Tax=Candida parapsilosis TaxID=5480 RepID=G8B6C0_CANPC|nr:uncharacterized protein CPAR2_100400 [Candida parapsilosis]KAF6047981.1 hypothetical protein FOB59_003024 [Candida parapsilosis]KAF6050052.1 hypothetical protein FOB58_003329 [Candida parapsilosis]KAF6057915.1 hypothetical protein FOB60_002470 [Candida parapsilosis]KAF6065378.1 hypothetical protein FOB61_001448 [Candida parapsilosis]KAI5903765.1 hypothetical protein K4G60_g2922 [Candida parapsilosis]